MAAVFGCVFGRGVIGCAGGNSMAQLFSRGAIQHSTGLHASLLGSGLVDGQTGIVTVDQPDVEPCHAADYPGQFLDDGWVPIGANSSWAGHGSDRVFSPNGHPNSAVKAKS